MKKFCINQNEDFVYKETDGVFHLLDLKTSTVETFNLTASFIWHLLESPITIQELTNKLCSEFNVIAKKAEPDIVRFIDKQLAKKHLRKI
jgi:hypothetical protein